MAQFIIFSTKYPRNHPYLESHQGATFPLTLAPPGASMAPLRFFRDSRKTTRRSTAVKGSTSHPNIFPPSLKFLTRGHPRSGHQARSTKVTSLQLLSSVRATFQNRSIWNFLHFMTPPGSTRCISGIFRFRPLGSGHEVTSPIEKAWGKAVLWYKSHKNDWKCSASSEKCSWTTFHGFQGPHLPSDFSEVIQGHQGSKTVFWQ